MLNIADLNIYLYQKTHLIKCFGCWLHARISKGLVWLPNYDLFRRCELPCSILLDTI